MGAAVLKHKINHRVPQVVSSNLHQLPSPACSQAKDECHPPAPVTPQLDTAPQMLEMCSVNHPAWQDWGLSKGCSLPQQRERLGIGFLQSIPPSHPPSS